MRIDVLTLFPEMFPGYLGQSLLKRAIDAGLVDIHLHDIRDWARGKHQQVDDRPFGGGPGMVLRPEPVVECVEEVQQRGDQPGHVVLLTPLVNLGSSQLEVLRSARALGLKTALCVGSWDHLSSKALIRDIPDRILVWNETQKAEAVTLHRVPADRVVVTGAQCYDQWFNRRPSRARDEFCEYVGLDPARPFILYVCSSLFKNTANEAAFVERWIQQVRSSADPMLREAGILIRPHPRRRGQ